VAFVVDEMALVQVYRSVLRVSPVSIIALPLHIHLRIIWVIDKGRRN
jgi:hypothetical protein